MKPKHIRLCLLKKLGSWLDTIEDEVLRKQMRENIIVTGGSITSMLMGEKPNDYDVYFKTKDTAFAVAEYYVKKFLENPPPRFKNSGEEIKIYVRKEEDRVKIVVKSAGIAAAEEEEADQPVDTVMMTRDEQGGVSYEYFEMNPNDDASEGYVEAIENAARAAADADEKDEKGKKKYRPIFLSSNAITLSHGIQVVVRFFGSIEEIHKNYDYVHCTCAYDLKTNQLRLPNEALTAILNKELRYVGSKYPVCSFIRMRKYIQRGWNITAGQIVKMAWDVSKLDLDNLKVLEEQLVGVDAAYFLEILRILKEDRDKGKQNIDRSYIMAVIDRIF